MPSAFVAGATGYTGREVVRQLRAAGIDTVAHVRPDSPRLAEWRDRFGGIGARVDATPWREDAMAGALRRARATQVFALLGTTRARGRRGGGGAVEDSYQAVDYGLTALLIRVCRQAAPGARFVYLSAAGVGPRARGEYLRVRWRVERELDDSGLPHVIARPSFITGPDRDQARPGERIAATLVDAGLAVLGRLGARRLQARYRSTSNEVLAEALIRLALAPEAAGVYESEELRAPARVR